MRGMERRYIVLWFVSLIAINLSADNMIHESIMLSLIGCRRDSCKSQLTRSEA